MTIPVDDAVAYDQRCQDFRSLNGFLWQSSLIIMTLTGGLWFAVASLDMSTGARSMLLISAGLANLIIIVALVRLLLALLWQKVDFSIPLMPFP